MKKILVYFGPPLSGKSMAAKKAADGKQTLWLNGYRVNPTEKNFLFLDARMDTELIVVDDVYNAHNLKGFIKLFYVGHLFVARRGKPSFSMPRPDVILICVSYASLWNSINKNWDENPWVWVYDFEKKEVGDE